MNDVNDVVAFAGAARTLPLIGREFVDEKRPRDEAGMVHTCEELLAKCEDLFRAEVCAIFLVRDGEAVLEAYRGYTHPYGTQIEFETLRKELRYKVSSPEDMAEDRFDGVTGWVASTGQEFSADSWEEIKCLGYHAGKPDRIKIWDDSRPFRCMFAVPLKLHGKTVGVLKVENKRDPEKRGVTFDDTDKHLMRTLADLFSSAIENIHYAPERKSELARQVKSPGDVGRAGLASLAARFDHSDMARVIERVPSQIETALEQEMPPIPAGPFRQVVLVGMGGSALPADIVNDAFADMLRVPVSVSRGYSLPPWL
ncbi:unnamed protein product, partial [marine sediment metagenome]